MDGNHFFLGEERPLFGKRILAVHKTKGNDRKVESTGGPFSTPGFRAQVARVELEISVFSFYGCLPFVRTIATASPRYSKKTREKKGQLKENPFTGSHAMCLLTFFLASNNNTTYSFFSVIDQRLGA